MGADAAVRSDAETRRPGDTAMLTGIVLEEMPSALYRVELESRQVVLAHVVGTVKRNFVRLLPGDRVRVELSPRDWTRGRITGRMTETETT
jgi:translation initiation factor IF-1